MTHKTEKGLQKKSTFFIFFSTLDSNIILIGIFLKELFKYKNFKKNKKNSI